MQFEYVVTDAATAEDREAVLAPLMAYNDERGPPHGFQRLSVLLRDPEGKIIGGLIGRIVYDWLYVELLAVPEGLRGRGVGAELMRRAEAGAIERGCAGIWLDTYEFQARGFYEKLGFEVFGTLDDHPRGMHRYFLRRRLPDQAANSSRA
jgi:GNAT superfamily N-acetyltransferase